MGRNFDVPSDIPADFTTPVRLVDMLLVPTALEFLPILGQLHFRTLSSCLQPIGGLLLATLLLATPFLGWRLVFYVQPMSRDPMAPLRYQHMT